MTKNQKDKRRKPHTEAHKKKISEGLRKHKEQNSWAVMATAKETKLSYNDNIAMQLAIDELEQESENEKLERMIKALSNAEANKEEVKK